jgi:hypothetical protein
MTILFLGEEGAYESASESGIHEGGSPIFFAPTLPTPGMQVVQVRLDAVIIPAQRFLALAPLQLPMPVLASGPPSLLAECLAAGCADYLREPWSMDEVEARLSRHTGTANGRMTGNWDGRVLSGPCGRLPEPGTFNPAGSSAGQSPCLCSQGGTVCHARIITYPRPVPRHAGVPSAWNFRSARTGFCRPGTPFNHRRLLFFLSLQVIS